MSFDFIKFANAHNVGLIYEGCKHSRPGWVQLETDCLFCSGNKGYHLGYNISNDYFNCWRCGNHWNVEVVCRLLKCTSHQAIKLINEYAGRPILKNGKRVKKQKSKKVKSPDNMSAMTPKHKKYLESRNFDADHLENLWKLKGTGPAGKYKHRIIAPIFFEGSVVSYQGRDITGKSPLKYKACSSENEVRDHKECLYGLDAVNGEAIIVVEGIFDVWRLGPGAVCTFGIEYTVAQLNLMRLFKKIFVMYDSGEEQANQQSEELAVTLSSFFLDVEIIDIQGGDPAELDQEDADIIVSELLEIEV